LAIVAFVVSVPMAWLVSVLGHWFPLENDFAGSVVKAKRNKKATVSAFIAMPILSFVAALFAESILHGVLCVILTWLLTIIFAVDFRTYEIPFKVNVIIFILGVVRLISDIKSWPLYVIGFFIMCALFSLNVISPQVSSLCKFISNKLEIIALAAIGLRVNIKDLIKQGKSVSLYGLFVALLQVTSAVILIGILL
jgi:hypothetical protein